MLNKTNYVMEVIMNLKEMVGLGFGVVMVGIIIMMLRSPQPSSHGAHGLDEIDAFLALQEADFNMVVLKNQKPVVVKFHATWCSPCKRMKPVDLLVAEEFGLKGDNSVDFMMVDVDENGVLKERYNARPFPCYIFFKNGVEKFRRGSMDHAEFRKCVIELKS